jgi:hypothetical protein
MPRTRGMEPLPPRTGQMEAALPPRAAQRQRPAKKKSRGQGLRRLAVALILILAIVAVVLIVTNNGGGNKGPVNAGDVHGQIDGLKQLIEDNEK